MFRIVGILIVLAGAGLASVIQIEPIDVGVQKLFGKVNRTKLESVLNIILPPLNAKVAIYNIIGQKIKEKVATGNLSKINVATLHRCIYFVRINDETTQIFIK